MMVQSDGQPVAIVSPLTEHAIAVSELLRITSDPACAEDTAIVTMAKTPKSLIM